MPAAIGPRFVLEAGFLVLLAVVVGIADLEPLLIVLVMALGWLLVSLIEYFAWRQQGAALRRFDAAAGPVMEEEAVVPPAVAEEQETVSEAEDRVSAARKSFADTAAANRTRFALDPLEPRPR